EEATPTPPGAWPERSGERVERRERAQTALLLGFPGAHRQDPDRHALHLLANALTGLGGRFFDELRERRSLAYAVSAHPRVRWLSGEFVAYIATSPERESEARAGLIDGFRRLAEEGLDMGELERARRYTLGSWRIRGRTNDAQLSRLIDALLFGNGLADMRDFEATIEAIDAEAVRSALARRFDPARIVTGVVRGRARRAPEPALPRTSTAH
ncbi:MAG: M16 family metallopeptidase, partial [Longimicrobiales bacterium]